MQIINNEMVWCFDVDGTLVEWNDATGEGFTINDPIDKTNLLVARTNKNNVRLLKEKKHRGCTIIVWSQGGYKHAAEVVTALQLTEYVDFCMTKPLGIVDDLDPQEWLPKRTFIPINVHYK